METYGDYREKAPSEKPPHGLGVLALLPESPASLEFGGNYTVKVYFKNTNTTMLERSCSIIEADRVVVARTLIGDKSHPSVFSHVLPQNPE